MKPASFAAVLLSGSIALANPLVVPRQDTSTSSASSSASSIGSLSSSVTSAATTSASVTTTIASLSTSSSSPTSSGATPTSTTLPDGITRCTQQNAEDIFKASNYTGTPALCGFSSGNNTIVVPANGFGTYITWNAGAFTTQGSEVTIHLDWTDKSGKVQWNSTTAAFKGFVSIQIDPSFLNGASSSEFRLVLDERNPNPSGEGAVTVGPIVKFLQQDTTPKPPPPTSFNALGLAIGLPVAVAVVVGVLLCLCCVVRKERGIFSKIKLPTRRKGYGVRQSRRQRTGEPVDEFDFDASAPIYRDEPPASYQDSTRDERSARAMGVFSAERNLHSTH